MTRIVLRFLPAVLLMLSQFACAPPDDSRIKVIVGAVLIDGENPPLKHSVVVVRDSAIAAAGPQQTTPIPAGSLKVNAAGQFLVHADRGSRVVPGAPANLLLLSANPLEDPENYERISRTMRNGEWVSEDK